MASASICEFREACRSAYIYIYMYMYVYIVGASCGTTVSASPSTFLDIVLRFSEPPSIL